MSAPAVAYVVKELDYSIEDKAAMIAHWERRLADHLSEVASHEVRLVELRDELDQLRAARRMLSA